MDKETDYLKSIQEGLRHVRGHAAALEDRAPENHPLTLIEEGRGSRDGCIRTLGMVRRAQAIVAWFGAHDLVTFKQDSYVAGKLMYIRQKEADELGKTREHEYFHILMSDYAPLIDYFAKTTRATESAETSNPNHHLFRGYQMTLALRGEWKEVARRAQKQLDAHPKGMARFMVDQRFYLALAHGDKVGMEAALSELTSEKMAKVRNDELEFGLTQFFIGTHATMYAKLAWRAGYEVEIDTPYIPKEWLPIAPLAKYEDPYPFMRAYDTDHLV